MGEAIEDFAYERLDNSLHEFYQFLERLFKYKAWSIKSIIPIGVEMVLIAIFYEYQFVINNFLQNITF